MEQLKELRERVIKANELYDELRAIIHIPDDEPFQREGIKILSEPFVKGVFTLAVIGQMSAGKSAFINALLEDEDILPTGHFQTTCTLTEIVWSTIKRLQVTYGDGHIEEYNGDEILGKLKDVAAINPKFESLPINHINEFILKGQGIKDILNNKDLIIKLSGRPTIDEELLKEYVLGNHKEGIEAKNRSTIPVHVYMEYPLAESYRGWRIVDTPGIGALGGIDQTTKDFLLNEKVDGAIFMFNGAEPIGRNDLSEMIKNAYSQLTDVAKERTFFVITHAGESANLPLRHVTVLEEAHNLLRATSNVQSQESSNLAGKSVEMLSAAIAEMRTYGESFIIADQSPSLLDRSAISNTNTKIVMNLPNKSDREISAHSIGLTEEQSNELSKLKTGDAVVYQKGWEEPVECTIDYFEDIKPFEYVIPDSNNNFQENVIKDLYSSYVDIPKFDSFVDNLEKSGVSGSSLVKIITLLQDDNLDAQTLVPRIFVLYVGEKIFLHASKLNNIEEFNYTIENKLKKIDGIDSSNIETFLNMYIKGCSIMNKTNFYDNWLQQYVELKRQ